MKAAGVGLLILGYAMLYAGLSNISTGGQGYGFLQALGFKGQGGVGINTQAFVQSIVPGGTSGSNRGSVQQSTSSSSASPVQTTTRAGGATVEEGAT